MITRRSIITGITGITAFIAAPAIVRVASLMPIRAFDGQAVFESVGFIRFLHGTIRMSAISNPTNWEPVGSFQRLLRPQQNAAIIRPVRIC